VPSPIGHHLIRTLAWESILKANHAKLNAPPTSDPFRPFQGVWRLFLLFQSNDILINIGNPLRNARIGPLPVLLFHNRFARLTLQKYPAKQRLAGCIQGGIALSTSGLRVS
jgi:hypothetical protein